MPMATKNKKTKKNVLWLTIFASVAFVALLAPQNTIIRSMSSTVDPYYWLLIKSIVVGVICLPFALRSLGLLFRKSMLKYTIGSAIFGTTAVITAPLAVYASQASYVSVIGLSFPVLFVLLSSWLLKEKLTHRTMAGIVLAMIGASVIVLVPFALSHQGGEIYPMGTFLAILNGISSSLATIFMKQANEKKVPILASVGVNVSLAAVVSYALFVTFGDMTKTPTDGTFMLVILYTSVGVTIFGNVICTKLYEYTNSAYVGVLMYVRTFAAIILPVFVLGEVLSLPMVIGGICILIALYVTESRKMHHFHLHGWRHH